MKTINTIENNEDLSDLIGVIEEAANTYKKASTKYTDNHIEHFFENLAANHKVFVRELTSKYNLSDRMPVKKNMHTVALFNEGSAIDMLLLCKEIEKEILNQAREAVHKSRGTQKQDLCKHLTFSEKALFEADQLLEEYE